MIPALAIAVFVAAYTLIATEKVHRTVAALGGAAAMLALGIVGADEAFYSTETAIDWNVVFLLLGMMIIVGIIQQTGLFEYLAIWAAKRAKGQPLRVMTLLVVITATASSMLDNVTTVLLVAPVTLFVCERLGVSPVPFLIAEALASNIGGTATLVGDPPNIIIASRADLSFNAFVVHLTPIVVICMVAFVLVQRWLFGRALVHDPARAAEVMALDEREAIRNVRLLKRSLVVLGAVLLAFVLHTALHVEPAVVALLGAGVLALVSSLEPGTYLREVEWETLAFFMGLFVMVGALVEVGVIDYLAELATEATGGRLLLATMLLLFVSAGLSAVIDNIPYVATMSPLVSQLIESFPAHGQGDVLWWALALGADFGGNATAVGASANVVIIGLARRNGVPISFWEFTKYGLVITAMTVALSAPYLWLRYFVLA
ncbi:MAG: SLC13 family permease [Carbonactinosporaceae bacterium]